MVAKRMTSSSEAVPPEAEAHPEARTATAEDSAQAVSTARVRMVAEAFRSAVSSKVTAPWKAAEVSANYENAGLEEEGRVNDR
ncbi:hypothetical protein GCM10009823_02080 [Brevibacterium salitolerans]|uniref:Uncharacterized protein n=1 Tax=Brevibacterium salitolerans TaxID=1403566 RepID=A0ABN2WA28_9MICO